MEYRNVLHNHKNAIMGSSTVHLHGVDHGGMITGGLIRKRRHREERRIRN